MVGSSLGDFLGDGFRVVILVMSRARVKVVLGIGVVMPCLMDEVRGGCETGLVGASRRFSIAEIDTDSSKDEVSAVAS